MQRTGISLLVLAALLVTATVLVPYAVLTLFAGVLFGVFLRTGGGWIATRAGIRGAFGVGLFILVILAVAAAFGFLVAPRVIEETHTLIDRVPEVLGQLRAWITQLPLGDRLIERIRPAILGGDTGLPTAFGSALGWAGNFVVGLFIGIYGALDPSPYRKALLALLAPSLRPRGEEVIDEAVSTLRHWLFAQLGSMFAVGVLTGGGLWLVGVPLPFALGTIAGLLTFIPNLGPVLALLPGLMLGMEQGGSTVWWVLGVYLGAQALESYLITPLLQQENVELPPGFTLGMQLLFAALFGLPGLALATPTAALALTLTRALYVHDMLEGPHRRPDQPERLARRASER